MILSDIVKRAIRRPGGAMRAIGNPREAFRRMKWEAYRRDGHTELLPVDLRDIDVRILVDPQDEGISEDLFVYRYREEHATRLFHSWLRPGMTILDAGANIGYYVLVEADAIGPKGRILAIEPAPRNVEILRANVALNDLESQVDVSHGAVGDADGKATLHLANRSNLHTMTRAETMDEYVDFVGTTDVPLYRIDSFLKQKGVDPRTLDVIRMDIEGFELQAFDGMRETIAAAERLIWFVEIHPKLIKQTAGDDAYGRFLEEIEAAGFRVAGCAHSIDSRVDEEAQIDAVSALRDIDEAVEVIFVKGA